MHVPCEAAPSDAPAVVRSGGRRRAHVHVGVMTVAWQAARAAIFRGRMGGHH